MEASQKSVFQGVLASEVHEVFVDLLALPEGVRDRLPRCVDDQRTVGDADVRAVFDGKSVRQLCDYGYSFAGVVAPPLGAGFWRMVWRPGCREVEQCMRMFADVAKDWIMGMEDNVLVCRESTRLEANTMFFCQLGTFACGVR